MTVDATRSSYAASSPHQAVFVVYINGIEVPAKSASMRYGVWQVPEMQIEMVADPILIRLGYEDRIQVVVFYYDDVDPDPNGSVKPAFRLFGEGEITGWGYRNTAGGRSIVFTVVNQIAVFSQLFVHFLTTLDDMVGHGSRGGRDVGTFTQASSELIYPFSLFTQGLIPDGGEGKPATLIKRPFDFLYNTIIGMIGSDVPATKKSVPAANFFSRWARLTNFHNRFVASPFFDEITDNANIFPVLRALQDVSAVDVIGKNLLPQLQNNMSIWDMLQLIYTTMLMEVVMIPSMPLVTVNLTTGHVLPTNFSEHKLELQTGSVGGAFAAVLSAHKGATVQELLNRWVPTLSDESRKTKPKRIPNYFVKPQSFFGIPPSCNVVFPSQLITIAYDETYSTQPTRLYFNDETMNKLLQIPGTGLNETTSNALAVGYPEAVNVAQRTHQATPNLNTKNFLLFPEEFYKGPVMYRKEAPPWLFFLKLSQNQKKNPPTQPGTSADGQPTTPPPPAQTGSTSPPTPPAPVTTAGGQPVMVTNTRNGVIGPDGERTYGSSVTALRPRVEKLNREFTGNRVPVDYILTWINLESNGDINLNDTDAVGYFQLSPENVATITAPQFPNGVTAAQLRDANSDASITGGLAFIQNSRTLADRVARTHGISWSQGDMWRLTQLVRHNSSVVDFADPAFSASIAKLGRPPKDWEEFYHSIMPTPPLGNTGVLAMNKATGTGGVVDGASGVMTSKSDPKPFRAPGARIAPDAVLMAASPAPPAGPPPPPVVSQAEYEAIANAQPDVYQLYAKFEFFRERYAKRSGSATVAWNPYVVPGFPAMIFDQRATRVDLACYITTVQLTMSNGGQRSTTLSFLYGRQLQEMFGLMSQEFEKSDAFERSSAPQEPIPEVSNIVQSIDSSEDYFRRLFYGAQSLFNKDAAFDFRKVIAYAPDHPGGEPVPIILSGPKAAAVAANSAAQQTVVTLRPKRDELQTALLATEAVLDGAQKAIVNIDPSTSDFSKALHAGFQGTISIKANEGALLRKQVQELDAQINAALSTIQDSANRSGKQRVVHTLDPDRDLVPLPSTLSLFENRDAAMRYNWRPICTLDEYIVFLNTTGEGSIPAFGHRNSVGARYFDRIRRLIPSTSDVLTPVGADGLGIVPADVAAKLAKERAEKTARLAELEATLKTLTQQAITVTNSAVLAVLQGGITSTATQVATLRTDLEKSPSPAVPPASTVPGVTNANFPQTRLDWDRALLTYRTNVRDVKAPRT